jgi:DNA gyrase subunit A
LANAQDEVIGMIAIENPQEESVLVVSEKGYGKRTYIDDPEDGEAVYRITNRGGKGVKTISITEKTGHLVAIKSVTDDDDLMIINKSGIAIRMQVNDLRVMGRATQGVKLINLKGNDSIAAVAKVMKDDNEEEDMMTDETSDITNENGTAIDNGSENETNNEN